MRRQDSKGFTLIELLVVIAIIAVLAAILFPVFAKAREKARQTQCINNVRQIATTMLMYAQDHDETFPEGKTWQSDLAGSLTGKVWDCPTSSFKGRDGAPDYFFVAGSFLSGAVLGEIENPQGAPMIGDLREGKSNEPYIVHKEDNSDLFTKAVATVDPRHSKGANFAFVDGHVELVKNVTAALFIPSLIDRSGISTPIVVAPKLFDKPKIYTDNSMRPSLAPYGITIAVGGASGTVLDRTNNTCFTDGTSSARTLLTRTSTTTPPGEIPGGGGTYVPSWWKIGPGGSQIITNTTETNNGPISWGGASIEPLFMANNGTRTGYITIVPNVDEPTAKFFAMSAISSGNGKANVDITSIVVGGVEMTPSGFQQLYAPHPSDYDSAKATCDICVGMIPLIPDKPVQINIKISNLQGGSNGGKALFVVEK